MAPGFSFPWPKPFWPGARKPRRESVPNGNWYGRRQNLSLPFRCCTGCAAAEFAPERNRTSALISWHKSGRDRSNKGAGFHGKSLVDAQTGMCSKTGHKRKSSDTLGQQPSGSSLVKRGGTCIARETQHNQPSLCYCKKRFTWASRCRTVRAGWPISIPTGASS